MAGGGGDPAERQIETEEVAVEAPMKELMNTGGAYAWTVDREALDTLGVWPQATVHVIVSHDVDSRPENDKALTESKIIQAWRRNEWFYGLVEVRMNMLGLTASEYVGGVGFDIPGWPSPERVAWAVAEGMIPAALEDMRRQVAETTRFGIAMGLGQVRQG